MARSIASYWTLAVVLFSFKFLNCKAFGDGIVNNPVHFPYGGSNMEMFLALAVPLENNRNVYFAFQFEANYALPENNTEFQYPPIITDNARSFPVTRKRVYKTFEDEIDSHGYRGKGCILRMICEAAENNLQHNGVLGDILHVILTPSTSVSENLPYEYEDAEREGSNYNSCDKYAEKCDVSLLGMVSLLEHVVP